MRKLPIEIRPYKGTKFFLWPLDSWNKKSMQYRDQMHRLRVSEMEE